MAEAAAVPGAMTAISATIEEVRAAVAAIGADVTVANHNAPKQVVVSGTTEAISALEAGLDAHGLRGKRLPVATGFHSPIVAPASVPLRSYLDEVEVGTPILPTWSNASASPYASAAEAVRTDLAAQVAEPVRFVELIEGMYDAGVRTFLELSLIHISSPRDRQKSRMPSSA